MSDLEILQKSFMESMDSMQKEFKKEKENLEKNIEELKEKYSKLQKQREDDNEMFKQNLKSNSEELIRIQNINRDLTKQLEKNKGNEEKVKIYEKGLEQYKKKYNDLNMQIPELKNQIEILKKEKNEYSEINAKMKENEEKIKKYEEELNSAKNLKPQIEQLNEKIKELEKQLKSEQDQKNKIISEKNDLENKINELNERIKKYEHQNKQLIENIKKSKEDEEKKQKEFERNSEMSIEKKNKFLTDILCEFLIKLNNSPYFLSVFDLLNKSLKNFDELNFFAKMSLKYNLPINDIPFIFFSNLRSYILLRKENSSLKDFLSQKSFKYSEISNDDISTLKMIRTVKLNDNTNLLDLYVKKKDLFFQKVELTFNLLKNKIISSDEEDKKESNKNILEDIPDILKIVEPPTNLEINFDKINLVKLSSFISYQINNIFSKLEYLTIEVSKINLNIFYSVVFSCQNLKSIKVTLNNRNLENNLIILNSIVPILFNYNKSLKELLYYNVPLLNKYLPIIVTSIKNSKLEKLALSNCFTSNVDIAMFNSYFSSQNNLTEIDFSYNIFNIPSLLSESLLNYNISKKLTSINFSNSDLSDDDINVIAKYLEENQSVKKCDISNNPLSQKSCFKLGAMLEKNFTMEQLNLEKCNLNGENIICIFKSKGNKGLKHIILNFNELGDLGLVGISGFIKNSNKLENLELICVGGNDMGLTTLVNCVKSSENIKIIHFEKNKISKMSIEMITKFSEELKNKGIKFFLDKIDGDKNMENIEVIEFN